MVFLIYLLGMVDIFLGVSIAVAVCSGMFLIVSAVSTVAWQGVVEVAPEENRRGWDVKDYKAACKIGQKIRKTAMVIFIPTILFSIFIPSSKMMAAMYLLPKIAGNEQVQQIPSKVLKALNFKLDEWVEDFTGDVKKEKTK